MTETLLTSWVILCLFCLGTAHSNPQIHRLCNAARVFCRGSRRQRRHLFYCHVHICFCLCEWGTVQGSSSLYWSSRHCHVYILVWNQALKKNKKLLSVTECRLGHLRLNNYEQIHSVRIPMTNDSQLNRKTRSPCPFNTVTLSHSNMFT